jgi:putative acetyltransferase
VAAPAADGVIAVDDPRDPAVRAVLDRHLAFARATTRKEDVHALGAEDLTDPAVTLFSYRDGDTVLGVAALKRIDDDLAEVKSMHTVEEARGRGVARALVEHLVAVARERGHRRLSLETGAQPAFAAARALYARMGFVPCGPFAGYPDSPNSAFLTRVLEP